MKYLVKFYVKHETTTGNIDYTLKSLEEGSRKYSKVETKPIKQFGEELMLVTAYEEKSTIVEASNESDASLLAIELYAGHVSTEILNVSPFQEEQKKREDQTKEKGYTFIVETFYGQSEVKAESYSDAVKKFESSSSREASYITLFEPKTPLKFINDAESLLFEMDANNCDEIAIKEGFGSETVINRGEVEQFLKLQNSPKRINRKKAISGEYDAI